MSEEVQVFQPPEVCWAIVEIFGKNKTGGRVSNSVEWPGMIRVDIPVDDEGMYRTEFYNPKAIFSIRPVDEEKARMFAAPPKETQGWDAPVIDKIKHERIVDDLRETVYDLERKLRQLPAPADPEPDEEIELTSSSEPQVRSRIGIEDEIPF